MNESVAEERFVGVGEAAEDEGVRAATCIAAGTVVVVAIANGSVVAGETQAHPSRG